MLADAKTVTQALLDGLKVTADAVDARDSTQRHEPAALSDLKRAAWATRVASGDAMFRMEVSVVGGKPWALPDIVAGAEERGRLANAWSAVREAMTGDLPTSIRTAFERASAENFVGPVQAQRQAIVDVLNQGRLPEIDGQALRQRNIAQQATIVDLAFVSLDEMVMRAETLASAARGKLLWSVGILGGIAALVGSSVLVVFRGVVGPLRGMTGSMHGWPRATWATPCPSRSAATSRRDGGCRPGVSRTG